MTPIIRFRDYYIWQMKDGRECLANANLDMCDKCQQVAETNAMWVIGNASASMIAEADSIKRDHGEIGELNANEDGECLCEQCLYGK